MKGALAMPDNETFEVFKQAKKDKVEGLPSEAEFKKLQEAKEVALAEFAKAAK